MRYFKPEEVKASDAAKVLDFLNTVEDAEAIATRIEFDDELDIGVGIAKRLLAAREINGGSFSNLQAVADVAYVGPERFTEIVCGLANLPLPWLVPEVNDVYYVELQRLRSIVDGFSKAYCTQAVIQITQDIASPLLGQPLNIVIKVFDAEGIPLANRALTLETNQGILTTQYGLDARRGEVVKSVTGVDGSARIKLSYQTYERLSENQRVALETELNFISDDVASPMGLITDFTRLTKSYEHERNQYLRGAMDVYFKDSEQQLKDAVNPVNHLIEWSYKTALLKVYLHPPAGENQQYSDPVVSMATHLVRWKNWFLPWYQSYRQQIQQRENLPLKLRNAKIKYAGDFNLGQNLLNETYLFMANQSGRIGAAVGEDIAEKSMMQFLAKDIVDLAPEQQVSLLPTLSLAARSIKASGQGTLALVNKTREDLEKKVADNQFDNQVDVSLLNSVNEKIDEFNLGFQTFTEKYTAFTSSYALFDENLTAFEIDFTNFNANYGDFDAQYAEFAVDYGKFKLDRVQIEADMIDFRANAPVVSSATDVSTPVASSRRITSSTDGTIK